MAEVTTIYRAVVTRDADGYWLAEVFEGQELLGATDAGNLKTLDQYCREVVAAATGLDETALPGLKLDFEFHTGSADTDRALTELRMVRAELRRAQEASDARTAVLVSTLTASGLSVRDIAAAAGITPGRVSQLAPRPKKPKKAVKKTTQDA
jgi:hypothetical protein